MSTIATSPIEIRENGVAWIIGANTKVIEVALDHLAHGWSPEEIFFQHYGQLSLAQIHAALAYYYEHQLEFDAEIKAQLAEVEELRKLAGETPGRKRLRALGLLS
jgi:uncharacterized protein (DUF433 family)